MRLVAIRPVVSALIIFLVTVAVRGFLLSRVTPADLLYGANTADGFRSGDEGVNIAVALAEHGSFADPFGPPTGPTAHIGPFFPAATSVIFRLLGYGRTAAIVRNGVVIAGMGLLYASFPLASAAMGLGSGAGAIAGGLAALFPVFRSSEVFRGRDEWAAAVILLWLTVLTWRMCVRTSRRTSDMLLFGIGWGILLQIQPSALPLLPVQFLAWLICVQRSSRAGQGGRTLRAGLLAVVSIGLVMAPWTIRNYHSFGKLFFVRDNFGLELGISNSDLSTPSLEGNLHSGWYCQVHPICSLQSVDAIRRVGEVRFNNRLGREALTWISGHPARFTSLTLSRAAAFWTDLLSNPVVFATRLIWSLLGGVGLILMWRSHRIAALLFGAILALYPLVYYAVQYSNRYVIPICFAIFLPAGFALWRIIESLERVGKPD